MRKKTTIIVSKWMQSEREKKINNLLIINYDEFINYVISCGHH